MLWLPKWMHEDTPPAEGVSRRTFLCLSAATVVAAVAPVPEMFQFQPHPAQTALLASEDAYVAYFHKRLYARITVPRSMMLIDGITDRPFINAMREETARALAEVNAEARRTGFRLHEDGAGWYDAEGRKL